jgi:hypothetical protein
MRLFRDSEPDIRLKCTLKCHYIMSRKDVQFLKKSSYQLLNSKIPVHCACYKFTIVIFVRLYLVSLDGRCSKRSIGVLPLHPDPDYRNTEFSNLNV